MRPGDLTEKEARVRVTPKSLTRLKRYRRVSTQYCQDMIFLNFYFDQFYAHLTNNHPLLRRHFHYNLMTLTISQLMSGNESIVGNANYE